MPHGSTKQNFPVKCIFLRVAVQDLWPGTCGQAGIPAIDTDVPHVGLAARPASLHGTNCTAFEALRHGVTRLGMEYAASPLGVRNALFVPHPLADSSRQVQEYASTQHGTFCMHMSLAFCAVLRWR